LRIKIIFENSIKIVRMWHAQRPLHGLTDKFVDIIFLHFLKYCKLNYLIVSCYFDDTHVMFKSYITIINETLNKF